MSDFTYLLVALPASISRSQDREEAFQALSSGVATENAVAVPFPIPEFKIGTLDALVSQADEIAKLDANVEGAVSKVADVLRNIAPGEEDQHKTVNDKPVEHYLNGFSWNRTKYRSDKSIAELLSILQKEVVAVDNDIKTRYSAYQQAKGNLVSVQRKQTGNLTTRSLAPLLSKSDFCPPSEYLTTLLVVVPKLAAKEWLKTYETLTPMVVPRSSTKLAEDSEYQLYNVTVFRKHAAEFATKARAAKFAPRDFTWADDAAEVDEQEARDIQAAERRLYGEMIRLARTSYSDLVAAWMHTKALRVFVESVLRYGLPLDFISAILRTPRKSVKRVKTQLDQSYGYLGGNAFGRDKKGNIKDDISDGVAGLSLGGDAYAAYTFFAFEVL